MDIQKFNEQKRQVVLAAISQLKPGLRLSLGSGSTSEIFIRALSQWPEVHSLQLTSTSIASTRLGQDLGLQIVPLETVHEIDYAIDGADAVDKDCHLLKGFGGALTREKIAAHLARELWIMVDERKISTNIPRSKIPCEIVPCALGYIESKLLKYSLKANLRQDEQGRIFVTDNSGWILDIDATNWTGSLQDLGSWLKSECGVIEHGLFFGFKVRLFSPPSN